MLASQITRALAHPWRIVVFSIVNWRKCAIARTRTGSIATFL